MMDSMKAKARTVRNGRYFVKRGAIDWTSHDFASKPFALSLQIDDGSLLRTASVRGMKSARISMEMFAPLPKAQDVPEIDDGLLDELIDDAEAIVLDLVMARDSSDDPIVFRVDETGARFVEAHDISLLVQGIVVTFNVQY